MSFFDGEACPDDNLKGILSIHLKLGKYIHSIKIWKSLDFGSDWLRNGRVIMSTPLGGGYIIFAFFAVRCPMSGVRRPMSGVTHGFRSFKGKVLELLSPNLVCRLIGSVACLGLLLAVVPLLLTE